MSCIVQTVLGAALQQKIESWQSDPFFKHASLGVYAVNASDGKLLFDYFGDKSLLPNSTLKVITSAATFETLGEDFHYITTLALLGKVNNAILKGDLLIIGSGDPTLGSSRFATTTTLFQDWVKILKERAITSIEGDILVDASCFEEIATPPSWLWEDVGNYYGAGPCGVNFYENSYELTFELGKNVGDPTKILSTYPATPALDIKNEVVTAQEGSGDRAFIFGDEYSWNKIVRGTLPLGSSTYSIRGSIPNPALWMATLLKQYLIDHGISVSGREKVSFKKTAYFDMEVIDRYKSPSLKEIIWWGNQKSINLYSECLLKTLGKGSFQQGTTAIDQFLKDINVPTEGIKICDGSGLSCKNLMTAKTFVQALYNIQQKPYFPALIHSFPKQDFKAGVKYVKTGFSSQGRGAVGMIYTKQGKEILFCILCNNFLGPSQELRTKIQEIVENLAAL